VVNAEEVYVDPSALARLYIHQAGSREMTAWRAKTDGCLAVAHHGRIEIINAICRLAFVGHLDVVGLEEALGDLAADFAEGRLRLADLLWRAALDRAEQLSRNHTPMLGTRTLDVLHVACALELKLTRFLTFDDLQRRLAQKVGLKPIRL
jgi:predicted nucleic acid-binding protein